ncbi:MAG: hypothetical protein IANPNBLG_04847 [Bryobacteraceae bacterium]|nr:hypothetical protein [Bryobacteraceae bacterium]
MLHFSRVAQFGGLAEAVIGGDEDSRPVPDAGALHGFADAGENVIGKMQVVQITSRMSCIGSEGTLRRIVNKGGMRNGEMAENQVEILAGGHGGAFGNHFIHRARLSQHSQGRTEE